MNGIGRLRTIGIAAQPTFGVPATSATFVLPLTNAPMFSPQVMKILNEAALGSSYSINDIEKTVRFTETPLEFKADEDQFPLMMKQRFSISSVTVTSEASVYQHTLSYQDTTNTWYTLFMQDDNRQDYVVSDALFDNHDIAFDRDFVRFTSSIVGAYPTQTAVTNAITQPKEFVGRMTNYLSDDVPGTVTATSVLSLNLNLDFGLNDEGTRFGLGSEDLAALVLTSDKYTLNVTQLKPDVSNYDDNENNQMKQFRVFVQSLDRYVVGSTQNTRPSIQVDVPRAKIESYNETPDLNQLVQEEFALTALKPVGVSGTPLSMTVINAVESY